MPCTIISALGFWSHFIPAASFEAIITNKFKEKITVSKELIT